MREYAKVSPAFWMTGSGRALRGCLEAQIVSLYLVTCPSANMIGLYYLPKALIIHETGLSKEGASKGLARASEAGFAFYDEAAELVWVPNAATYQLGDRLAGKDKRKEGVLRELFVFRKHTFARHFLDKYAKAYELDWPDWIPSPLEAPSEPLRSQEQEQEQEQEQDIHSGSETRVKVSPKRGRRPTTKSEIPDDWNPSERCLEILAGEGIEASVACACIPDFIDYWRSEQGLKADWDATFRGRLRYMRAKGRLPSPVERMTDIRATEFRKRDGKVVRIDGHTGEQTEFPDPEAKNAKP